MPKYQKSHNETFLIYLLTGIPPIPYNDNGDENGMWKMYKNETSYRRRKERLK